MYAKVFSSIYDGTLARDWKALVTFQQLLILCRADGVVDMTPEAISRRTGLPIEIIQHGIAALERPDPESRSPADEGRRIVRLDSHRSWGWQIVNYLHYRNLRDGEQVRALTRERVRKHRERRAESPPTVTPVTRGNAPKRQAEAEADAEATTPAPTATQDGESVLGSLRSAPAKEKQRPPRPKSERRGLSSAVRDEVRAFPSLPPWAAKAAIQAVQRYAKSAEGAGAGDPAYAAGLHALCEVAELRAAQGDQATPIANFHAFARFFLRGFCPRFNAARAAQEHAARVTGEKIPTRERIAGQAAAAALVHAFENSAGDCDPERVRLMADMIRERVDAGYTFREARDEVETQLRVAGL